MQKSLARLLESHSADYSPLPRRQTRALLREWAAEFTPEVLARAGTPVYRKIRWHAFSYGFTPHEDGARALASYLAHRPLAAYLLDESSGEGCVFTSPVAIDLSPCRRDLYVFPDDRAWTMAFTHEQPAFGPYYAQKRLPTGEGTRSGQ